MGAVNADHVAHVIDQAGVTTVPFKRDGGTWSNTEAITLVPGAVLDMGGGMTLANYQTRSVEEGQ